VSITFNNYAPFDSGAGANVTEAGWQAMQRRTGVPGVIRGSLNELLCFGDSTGRQVKVMSGEAWAEGFWGATTGTNTLAIAANASGNTRKDLVVWRINVTTNLIELDVITGTPSATPVIPSLTRNSSIYESPIAVVTVVNGAVTIASADVLDVRWWGGPTTPTTTDDWTLFADAVSSCPRNTAVESPPLTSGVTYLALTTCMRDVRVSTIKYYVQTARVGGFRDLRVLTGYSRHELTDVTATIAMDDLTTGYKVTALPSALYLTAGQFVCFAVLTTATTTAPKLAGDFGTSYNLTGGTGGGNVVAEIINSNPTTLDPLGRWSSVFLGSQSTINSTIRVHQEGTWSKRAGRFWFALGPTVN
jgi:hypothetical protein